MINDCQQGERSLLVTNGIPEATYKHATGGPRTGSQPEGRPSPSRNKKVSPVQPLRVLVVEDEAIIAMEIEMTLEDFGAEVVGVAMTAAQAVRLAMAHRPDCVTMDINLKGDRDGISAALEIHGSLGIRSIFVSAFNNEDMRERAKPACPVDWVLKPIRTGDLIRALDRVREEG